MSLASSSFTADISANEHITTAAGNIDVHSVSSSTTSPTVNSLVDGTGADKAQKAGRQVITLSTTPLDVDLTSFAGGINNANINFTKIKEVWLRNLDAAISITVGGTAGAPTNAWTNFLNGTTILEWNELLVVVAHKVGITVAGANKLLRLTAASGTPMIEVILIGEGS